MTHWIARPTILQTLFIASALTMGAGSVDAQVTRDLAPRARDSAITGLRAVAPPIVAEAEARVEAAKAATVTARSPFAARADQLDAALARRLLDQRNARIVDEDFRGVIGVAPAGDGEITLERLDVNTENGILPLFLNRMGGDYVYDGDIVVPPSAITQPGAVSGFAAGRPGSFGSGTLWDDALLPFEVAQDFCCNAALAEAIAVYEADTGFRFVPRDGHRTYLRFVNAEIFTSSRAQIGKQQGENTVRIQGWRRNGDRIDTTPLAQTIAHEIGHELGLIHEHLRRDRDSFIARNPNCRRTNGFFEGIVEGWIDLTNVAFADDSAELLTPYDFASMMHYNFDLDTDNDGIADCSTWVRLDTCTNRDPAAQNCQGGFPSAGMTARDREGLARLYAGVPGLDDPTQRRFTGDNIRYLGRRIDRCLHGLALFQNGCDAASRNRVAASFCRVHGFTRARNLSYTAMTGTHTGWHAAQGWRTVAGFDVLETVLCDTPSRTVADVASGALERREFRGVNVRIGGRDIDRCLWGGGITGDRCSIANQRVVANAFCRDRNFERADQFATRLGPSPALKGYHRDRDAFINESGLDVFTRITCLRTTG